MDFAFQDRSQKILVIDSSGATRTLIIEVLRQLGFSDLTGVPTVKDAIGVLEAENIGWIVGSLAIDQPENLLQLQKLISEESELKRTRFSFLVAEDDLPHLPVAYKYGAMSHHGKPFTKESLKSEFEELLQELENWEYRSTLVSACYLRRLLKDLRQFEDLLDFERALIEFYPSESELFFNLVEPMAELGKKAEAAGILKQIKLMRPSAESKVAEHAKKYLPEEEVNLDLKEAYNFLGLRCVIVIEPDESMQSLLREIFLELGLENIHCFQDGIEAAEFVKNNPNPDLIIMEWRIPQLAGPLLLQRLKKEGGSACPIIVTSSLLKKDDHPLVKEMGVSIVLDKPYRKENMIETIIWTIQQDRCPSEQGTMERKIRACLKEKKFDEAMAVKADFMSDSKIHQAAKEAMEAEFAFVERRYEAARDHGVEAIKLAGDSLFMLNLLGKTLMLLRDFEVALRCFKKAQEMSPLNIERLCQIAEVQSELGQDSESQESLDQAEELDQDNVSMAESRAKIAINAGDTKTAKEVMGQLDAIENIVSFMNNSAVAMARCGMVDQSIEQYRKTMKSIPDDREYTKAIVMYNLALAHARADELDEARLHLSRAVKIKGITQDRAKSLLKRIDHALESGSPLNLVTSQKDLEPGQISGGEGHDIQKDALPAINLELLARMNAKPGEIGVFLLYGPKNIKAESEKIAAGKLRYQRREAIEREESHGADKAMAAS